jgi:nucleoid-associated protein YgaU
VAVGNVTGVGQVNDSVKVTQSGAESRYYTVKSGDTLSAISKAMYGSAMSINVFLKPTNRC